MGIKAILAKYIDAKTDAATDSDVNKWAICPVKLDPADDETHEDNCYFSTQPFNAPGQPSAIEFFDSSDVNKTVVASTTIVCEKAESVFKRLFDFYLDPMLSFVNLLLENMG